MEVTVRVPRTISSQGEAASESPAPCRIALAHDWLCGLRGGELVLDAIVRALTSPATPPTLAGQASRLPLPHLRTSSSTSSSRPVEITSIYTMFADGRPLTPAIDAIPRVVSLLGRLPGASGRARRWLLPLFPSAVEDLSRRLAAAHARSPIDLLISTSSAAIKGLRPPPGVPHVCYIHAPARYLWSLESEYARGSRLRAAGLALFGPGLRAWDRATASSVTRFIANSHHTANLVRQAYSKIARTPGALHVVHPPVRTDYFTPPPSGARRKEFWLLVSALEPYKRVELAIDAAHLAGKRLVIAGSGSESKRLRAHADRLARHGPRGHAVEFVGRVSDETLRELYRTARLFVFPQIEDFGISAVEAQASGLPVVAYARGGALDTVIPRVTGAFFGAPSAESLAEATLRCPRDVDAICRACALRFAQERFDRELLRHLKELLGT